MSFRHAAATLLVLAGSLCGADPSITIDTPLPPPGWALLERQLLNANSKAADRFAAKFLDERGYLLHTMRWGTLDGPDDAIETFYNWTLLHGLGGSGSVLKHYKKALEGHYKQYGELRTKLAKNGAYYKEFITQSDWFHTGEGMRRFMLLGLSDPNDQRKGSPTWYHYTGNLFADRLIEIYMRSMDPTDLERIPMEGYDGYLQGKNPEYPVQALRSDLAFVRDNVRDMDADSTTPDTRLTDYLRGFNPVAIHALTSLTMGAYLAGNIWTLHSRFRYFDPFQRRVGLPEDVAALVEKLEADTATLVQGNVDAVEPRTVAVQAGGYGEHRFESVEMGGKAQRIAGPLLNVRLQPGAGARLRFRMARYVTPPTLAQPWDRGWFGKS